MSDAANRQELAEAWGDYLDRHRDEIAENFERAAVLIRAGDTHGLAEHVGRNRRARAEAAASDSHAAWTHENCNRSGWIGPGEPCPICEDEAGRSSPERDLAKAIIREAQADLIGDSNFDPKGDDELSV